MSTRGRGLSGEHPDHSRQRHFEDIAAFVASIGGPVGVFGHSMGAVWVLGGAALAAAHLRGIALYEPDIPEPGAEVSDEAYGRLTVAVAEGRMADAVRLAVSEIIRLNDDEQAFFSLPLPLEIAEKNIPVAAREGPELNRPLDDVAVEKLTMPVLLIQGAVSGAHFKEAVRHLVDRIDHAQVAEIADAGHLGPLITAEAVARELVLFFTP